MRGTTMTLILMTLTVALAACPGRRGHGDDDDDDDQGAINGGGGGPNGDPGPGDADPDPGGNAGDPGGAPGTPGGGQDPGQVGPSNGCIDIFDCAGTCPDGDDLCLQDCFDAAPAAGQAAFGEVMTCYQGACAAVPADQIEDCLVQSCPDELAACS